MRLWAPRGVLPAHADGGGYELVHTVGPQYSPSPKEAPRDTKTILRLTSCLLRTGGSHTAPLTHTVIPPAQRVVHTSYRLAEGCIVRKKEVFFNYFIGRNTFYIA